MRWRRRRHAPSGEDAARRLAAADAEVELSRERLREAHETVVKPLQDYAAQNNFASIIAASLAQGRRKGSA